MGHLQNAVLLLFFIMLLIIVEIQFSYGKEAYSNHASCIDSERKALVKFREGLIDEANRLSSWSGEDCCSWKGVSCNNLTGHVVKLELRNPVLLDDFRYYFGLRDRNYTYFANNRLGGKLNPSLLGLKQLKYLDLSMNNFSNIQIPKFLGSLKNLRYLNLSKANFFGNIPNHLGNLTSLQYLNLGVDYHYDTSPLTTKSLQWVAQLSSLKSLDLSGVQVEESKDWFNWIAMLPSLSSLNLRRCGLELTFRPPPASLVNLTLASLDLGENYINSTVPLWLFNISSLVNLSLDVTQLRGSFPSMFKNLKSLASLDLSDNLLCSSLPDTLCNLTSLVQISMQTNNIQGSLPICLGNLTSLTALSLAKNDIKGAIPSTIGQLTKLNFLDLSNNQLNGTVLSTIGQLTKLNLLELSNNFLSGTLSELHFEKLTKLKELSTNKPKFDLNMDPNRASVSNKLKLNVSIQWIPPFQLESIEMSFTQTGPQFPQWLRTQKNVENLIMDHAGISGPLPDWFANVFSHISVLDLSYNNLSGSIPDFHRAKNNNLDLSRIFLNSNKFDGPLKPFPPNTEYLDLSGNILTGPIHPLFGGNMTTLSLQALFLDDNQLSGNILDDICNNQDLSLVSLSNNQLSGRIPPCLGNLRYLNVLVLSNNSFSGHIPSDLGYLEVLSTLHLSENKFYGQLPPSLQNLKELEILDLGGNQLKGTIPEWIGKELLQLKYLRLQSNNFYGDIPLEICQLSSLQVLNLAQNNLTGHIPHCFQNLTVMESKSTVYESIVSVYWTDFLLNIAKGREILYTWNLYYVKSMVLSDNRLIGEIPNELMDLVELQTLDLSNNCLSGKIPAKIGNMKHLESLNLARNQLSGAIPPSLANIDSLSYLNLSFNNLSGRIPSGNQLQTLNNESIYEGNCGLCGKPLPNSCPGDKSSTEINGHVLDGDENDDGFEFSWFYIGIGQGFAVGLVGVLCIFHFNKSLRYAYFQFLEDVHNKIWIVIAVKISKLKRLFN